MSDLRELYQEMILDHSRRPRNFGALDGDARRAEGVNPLCGDEITVYVTLDGDAVRDVRFEGTGCAISTASASLMTEAIKGRTAAEARALFERFHAAITGPSDGDVDGAELGKLVVLVGVRAYPIRVKCASLAWHTLRAALSGGTGTVTTE